MWELKQRRETKVDNYANNNNASSNCFFFLMHSPIHCLLLHVVELWKRPICLFSFFFFSFLFIFFSFCSSYHVHSMLALSVHLCRLLPLQMLTTLNGRCEGLLPLTSPVIPNVPCCKLRFFGFLFFFVCLFV